MPMPAKWRILAGDMLDAASDRFSTHGCNDWDFPRDWTVEDRRGLARAMYRANGDPEGYDPENCSLPDWWVMRFLADLLRSEE